jgi:hypothetical protein
VTHFRADLEVFEVISGAGQLRDRCTHFLTFSLSAAADQK